MPRHDRQAAPQVHPGGAAPALVEGLASGVQRAADRDGEKGGTDSKEAARARLGTTVGGYRLAALLGVGGTAAVYRGEREGMRVAVKVLHGWLAADSRAKKRFLREARVSKRLAHPALVPMLAEGEDPDGTVYLVMELAEGETLETRRQVTDGRLPYDEVLRLADELLAVLALAHAHGIVHRDIKPANLMMGADGRLRVLDFGIARVTELSDAESLVTRTGAVLGTVFFMAPEQALGVRDDIDARSDVWAVGATLFTLLSGRLVHKARTVNEALVLVATQPAPPLRSLCAEVPSRVANVIDRALAFDRNDRFPDADVMRSALRRALAGEPEHTGGDPLATLPETSTLPERLAKTASLATPSTPAAPPAPGPSRRVRLALVAGAAGIGSLLLLARVAGLLPGQSESSVSPESPPSIAPSLDSPPSIAPSSLPLSSLPSSALPLPATAPAPSSAKVMSSTSTLAPAIGSTAGATPAAASSTARTAAAAPPATSSAPPAKSAAPRPSPTPAPAPAPTLEDDFQ